MLLGVTGSIAAYKAAEVARLLVKAGAHVQVAMTEAATRFVGPATFHAITSRPPLTELFALGASAARAFDAGGAPPRSHIEHVEHAHAIDLVVVAPATATTLARFAAGLADDPLAAIVLATQAPILVAPAMEPGMWLNAATRENVERLERRGFTVVGPSHGELASGRTGLGRMVEPEVVVAAALRRLGPRDLAGRRIVITAGPTWEAIDPVRVLSNRSTGALGIELARVASARGADVVLILGPTELPPPPGVETVRVESAEDMLAAGRAALPGTTVLIATAAVSDFRPESPRPAKLKRGHEGARVLSLVENPDVLATLSAELRALGRAGTVIVGFAAETEDLVENARAKLERKGCDLVIANVVGRRAGFGGGPSEVVAVHASGSVVPFGPAPKVEIAQFVLDQLRGAGEQDHR